MFAESLLRVAWCACIISLLRDVVNPIFAKIFKSKLFPRRGKFLQKIFRGRFPGHSETIHHRQQAKRKPEKPAIIRTPPPRPIRTNANMTEHIRPKASATYPARDHQKTDTQSRRKGPAPSRRENRGGAFQVAADHADKGRPASKLYAHARTHQHNTHAEHRHTQRHTPKKKTARLPARKTYPPESR